MKWWQIVLTIIGVGLFVTSVVLVGVLYVQNKNLQKANDTVKSDLSLLQSTSAANAATYQSRLDDLQHQLGDSQSSVTTLQRSLQYRDRHDRDFETATGVTLNQLEQLFSGGTSGDSETDAAVSWLTEFGKGHGSTDSSQGAGVPSTAQKD